MTDIPQWALDKAEHISDVVFDKCWECPTGLDDRTIELIARALAEAAKPAQFTLPPGKSMTLELDGNGDLHVSVHDAGGAIVNMYGFACENIAARRADVAVYLGREAPEVG